jgi:hypothetical protein
MEWVADEQFAKKTALKLATIRASFWRVRGEALTAEGALNLDSEVLGIIRFLSDRLNNSCR